MTVTYRLLFPEEVKERWDVISKLLNRAVEHGRGEVTTDDILAMVGEGRMGVLALEEDGEIAAVTAFEILVYPHRRILNFAFTGGRNARSIVDNFDKIEEVARSMDADAISCMCRPAVARLIRRLLPTVEQAYVVMEHKVTR